MFGGGGSGVKGERSIVLLRISLTVGRGRGEATPIYVALPLFYAANLAQIQMLNRPEEWAFRGKDADKVMLKTAPLPHQGKETGDCLL